MAATAEKKTFKGSCHCGFVTYSVALDPTNQTASRCNCSWCQKPCYTNLEAAKEDFKLLTPDSIEELSNYNPKGHGISRWFCGRCGIHVLREGSYEYEGQKTSFFKVNLLTIDQPQEGIDLSDFKMGYVDGLSNKFHFGDKPFSGGTV